MSTHSAPFFNANGGGPQGHTVPGADRASANHSVKGYTHVVRFSPRTLIPQAPPAPTPPPPATPEQRERRIRAACDALRGTGHVRYTHKAAQDAEGNVLGMLIVCKYCSGDVFLEGREDEFIRLIMLHVRACETPGAQAAYARALDADKENAA